MTKRQVRPFKRKRGRIVLEQECRRKTGMSRWTRWRLWRKGEFPKPMKLTSGLNGWFEDELDEWLESRPRAA